MAARTVKNWQKFLDRSRERKLKWFFKDCLKAFRHSLKVVDNVANPFFIVTLTAIQLL
jgi:hypothetical protein